MTAGRSVEILEGNDTIRRIMSENLRRAGIEVHEASEDDAGEEVALRDLLVADVDSGVAVSERVANYMEDDRLVIFCGLRDSRDQYANERWVDRPFTPAAFLTACADALGVTGLVEDAAEPPFDPTATAALKAPPSIDDSRDEPITRELGYDEAQELERRLGLDPNTLSSEVSDLEDAFEVLEIDDSAILSVDHLQFALGGKLRGGIESRRVDSDELEARREDEIRVRGTRSTTFNQTMPDTPHALNEPTEEGEKARERQVTSNVGATPQEDAPTDGQLETLSRPVDADLHVQIRGVARMLAESWQRIALTSRTEDRADRIERVLAAAVGQGLRGAAEEVQRIPQASGFSGSLSSLTFVEVVRTVRDRRLRGRLEVAVGDDAFVVHMDGRHLEEIDSLSGNVDGMLLDILHQGGALAEDAYSDLVAAWESGRFNGPLELELARQEVVDEAALASARVVRAREIFRRLCQRRGGQFAFLDIRPGDGQPWPVDPLRVNVDQLMLEILRESSIDTGDSQATASTHLQLDPNRAAALEMNRLTEEERSVMLFFREGDTLDAARDRLQQESGPEHVDRIVDRLKKVELLKRSDPSIEVSEKVSEKVPPTTKPKVDATVISDLSGALIEEEKRRQLAELSDNETDKTTSLKANWDLIPDTGELDLLIEESIAGYVSDNDDDSGTSEDE